MYLVGERRELSLSALHLSSLIPSSTRIRRLGVVGFTLLLIKLKVAPFPQGMNVRNLFGLGLLASIGFTMSLFITSLAFTHPEYMVQAKIGIFAASIIGGVLGYITLSRSVKHK